MDWVSSIEQSESRLGACDAKGAFLQAFGALETCYSQQLGIPETNGGFSYNCKRLLESKKISPGEFERAGFLNKARGAVVHKYGFEPSLGEARRCIDAVSSLCSRFATRVSEVMVKPVICARLNDPVGQFVARMRREGISQFPVVDEADRVVGTLDETAVFDHWENEDGILDPATPVREIMSKVKLPEIAANATLDDLRRRLKERDCAALLILHAGKPTGIVTKLDLLQHLE